MKSYLKIRTCLAILFSWIVSTGALRAIDAVDGGGGGPIWGFPPTAAIQGTEAVLALGTSFTLGAVVGGTAPITLQWYHNNSAIPGERWNNYTIASVTMADAGDYYLNAANAWGSAASHTVKVKVVPVILTIQPESKELVLGASTKLSVAARGVSPFRYQWFFNHDPIPGATLPDFQIQQAALNHDGTYHATVSNAKGTVITTNVEVIVTAPPRIERQPRSEVVSPGDLVSLSVEVIGRGPFDFRWNENGLFRAKRAHLSKLDTYTFRAPMVATTLTFMVTVSNQWSHEAFGEPAVTLPAVVQVSEDVDGDKIPDLWEKANGLDPKNPLDAVADFDNDGVNNRDEALAGTNPNDASSVMRLVVRRQPAGGDLMFEFQGVRDRSYAIQAKEGLGVGEWLDTWTFPAQLADGLVKVSAQVSLDRGMQIYRLVTPAP